MQRPFSCRSGVVSGRSVGRFDDVLMGSVGGVPAVASQLVIII